MASRTNDALQKLFRRSEDEKVENLMYITEQPFCN
jgi:hypothetical protein